MNNTVIPLFEHSISEGKGNPPSLRFALTLRSYRAALRMALEVIGLKPDEGMLVPTFGFDGTAEVVRDFGAVPVLVDCRPEDFNVDVADAEQRLLQAQGRAIKVVAIMPVHFAGQIGDVTGVRKLAEKYGLKIVEDGGPCWPAFYRETREQSWKSVGASADVSCFSFYANQPSTTDERGMVCTAREEYAKRLQLRCESSPTDLTAAVGHDHLRNGDRLQLLRTQVADHYENLLSDVEELILPSTDPDRVHSWHLYVVRLQTGMLSIGRDEVIQQLKQAGIRARVPSVPLHLHPYYRDTFGYAEQDLPCAAQLSQELISLPISPDMSPDEVEYISEILKEILAEHQKSIHFSIVQGRWGPGDDADWD